MAPPMHDCEPVGLEYFHSAPVRIVAEATLPCTPEQLFACLEDASAWPRWVPVIQRVEWTSARPFGVGTTRTVSMVGGIVGEEEFFVWEAGHELAFFFRRGNVPVDAFAELYQVQDLGGGRLRLRWSMCMTPQGSSKWVMKLLAPIMGRGNTWMLGRLGAYAAEHY